MATYRVRIRTTAIASGAVGVEIRAGAARGFILKEVHVGALAATVLTWGLNRSNAIGVTPGTTTTPVAEESNAGASSVTIAQSWGTAPTIPGSAYMEEWTEAATIGAGVIIPMNVQCDVSKSLILVNLGAAAWPVTGLTLVIAE